MIVLIPKVNFATSKLSKSNFACGRAYVAFGIQCIRNAAQSHTLNHEYKTFHIGGYFSDKYTVQKWWGQNAQESTILWLISIG